MKSIQALCGYFPKNSGGTEVYVDTLAQELNSQGLESCVVASIDGKEDKTYNYNGVEVYRYPVFPGRTQALYYQQEPHGGFEYFEKWLEVHKGADIYHQHSWHFNCGVFHLKTAKQLGMKTVVTIHIPEPICLRRTMMLHGQQTCDGQINVSRCSQCLGSPEKVPDWTTQVLGQIPLSVSTATQKKLTTAKNIQIRQLGRAIGIPPRVIHHQHQLRQMVDLADLIVAPCQWLYDALLLNGIPQEKLVLCRQGVSRFDRDIKPKSNVSKPLKIGFLGRWQETKGAQVLAEAVSRLPSDVAVELTIHGLVQVEADRVNRDRVLAIAQHDPRIRVAEKLSRDEVPKALSEFDILAVPSQWLETGPLVVLEAYATGTPVIGSNLGGIAELVNHGVDGWLVPPQDVEAWKEAINYLALNPDVLVKLRQGIQPVRTMKEVATEMGLFYQRVLQNSTIDETHSNNKLVLSR